MKPSYSAACVFLMISLFSILSCDRVVTNSSENDELIASVSSLQGGASFKAIAPTIIAKCAYCHQHQAWYEYDENRYASENLVIAGDPAGSKMYYRLSTATVGSGPRNMPDSGGVPLTDTETELLFNWVNSFGF